MERMKEALFYKSSDSGSVQCLLCPHNCKIENKRTGICGVRKNKDGKLYSLSYGIITSSAVDPIEKKPLYHFHPGSPVYSIGTKGCTFKCPFCQNWQISQRPELEGVYKTPDEVVDEALKIGTFGIAFTYSEPIIWYEYLLDTAKLAQSKGLKTIMVTNGHINPEPLEMLLPYIDAMNIDLKCYTEEGYSRIIKGNLEPVKSTIISAKKSGCHIEITTLIVPDLNDDHTQLDQIVNFTASIDNRIPWHVSRYFPNYKFTKPPVDSGFFTEIINRASETLHYVYPGNISLSSHSSDTKCPQCGNILISRSGYRASIIPGIKDGKCSSCGHETNIIT